MENVIDGTKSQEEKSLAQKSQSWLDAGKSQTQILFHFILPMMCQLLFIKIYCAETIDFLREYRHSSDNQKEAVDL